MNLRQQLPENHSNAGNSAMWESVTLCWNLQSVGKLACGQVSKNLAQVGKCRSGKVGVGNYRHTDMELLLWM